jgi:hypothetical protein
MYQKTQYFTDVARTRAPVVCQPDRRTVIYRRIESVAAHSFRFPVTIQYRGLIDIDIKVYIYISMRGLRCDC